MKLRGLETYNDNKMPSVFTLDEYELKAIQQQLKELGGFDEKQRRIYRYFKAYE